MKSNCAIEVPQSRGFDGTDRPEGEQGGQSPVAPGRHRFETTAVSWFRGFRGENGGGLFVDSMALTTRWRGGQRAQALRPAMFRPSISPAGSGEAGLVAARRIFGLWRRGNGLLSSLQGSGNSSQGSGSSSQETGRSSQETGSSPQETGKSSQETGSSPQETGSSSQETGSSSQETGKSSPKDGRGPRAAGR